MKLIFLLEEPSTKYLLDVLLPKILPEGVEFQTIPHKGKRDLQRSIPRKLRGWNEPGDIRFVIVHDQDAKDCVKLKGELLALCEGINKRVLVRIACQEMESWYFGDVKALAAAYDKPKLSQISAQKKYRIPDDIPSPKEELYKLLPEHLPFEVKIWHGHPVNKTRQSLLSQGIAGYLHGTHKAVSM